MLPLVAMLWSCSDDVIDDLSGTYDDIQRYNFTTEKTEETTKLKKGLKYLHMVFDNGADISFDLKVVSREWTLQPGVYTPMASVNDEPKANKFYGFIAKGSQAMGAVTEGQLEVSVINNVYYISGLLTGGDGNRYVLNYRGRTERLYRSHEGRPRYLNGLYNFPADRCSGCQQVHFVHFRPQRQRRSFLRGYQR